MRFAHILPLCALIASACSDPAGPATGAISITVATTGLGGAPGYQVAVDDQAPMPLSVSSSMVIDTVPGGSHSIRLTDIPSYCSVDGPNPVTVKVASGATAKVTFGVTCATNANIRVTVTTGGQAGPATYTVGVDSGSAGYLLSADIPANGAVSIILPPGRHSVKLVVPANCTVTSPNNVPVTAAAGVTAGADFSVTCTGSEPKATLRVTAATTGPAAPASYTVGVDEGATGYLYSALIPANGTTSITLTAGQHTVKLVVPANCTVTSPNNVLILATALTTTDLGFAVTCATTGTVRVTVGTTGPDPDVAYSVSIDGAAPAAITTTSGLVLAGVTTGSHMIWLGDIAANCTVSGPNPATVTVAAGATTDLNFALTCVGGGSLRVTVTTVGSDVPATQSFGVDQAFPYTFFGAVPANGTGLITLPAGDHIAWLSVRPNCTITSPNNVPVTITAGATIDVAFRVNCVANGTIRVTVVTTGNPPFGGYHIYHDMSESTWHVPPSGKFSAAVAPGHYSLLLGQLPANCHTHNRSATAIVTSGVTTDVTFEVTCVVNGNLSVTVATTGSSAPETFMIGRGPDDFPAIVAANGTTSISMTPGNHTVSLSLPATCTSTPSSVQVSITSMATTDLAFTVSCQ